MKRLVLLIAGLIGMAIVLYVAAVKIQQWHAEEVTVAVERERAEHDYQTQLYQEKIEDLQKEIALFEEETVPEERLAEALGDDVETPPVDAPEIRRGEAARRLSSFMVYLDGRNYMKPYLEGKSTRDLLEDALAALSGNRPLFEEEKSDLESLLRNLVHFYRVLKKEPTQMIAAVLREEADVLEPVLADVMIWFTDDGFRGGAVENLPPPPDKTVLYDYAAYFLETLGGKSYLARRGGKIRLLATYYSLLVLDLANDEGVNVHGIDIRPHLDIALNDIRSRQGLMFKKRYTEALLQLKAKYQAT